MQRCHDATSVVEGSRRSHDGTLVTLQQQQDRLKLGLEECARSIVACNASISTQCDAVAASTSSSVVALQRSVRDLELGTQRHVEALTAAVQAISG